MQRDWYNGFIFSWRRMHGTLGKSLF